VMRTGGYAAVLALASMLCGCGTSLHDAVAAGRLDRAAAMLQRNPRLVESRDRLDKTPLHHVVTFHRPEALELLTAYGADIDARDATGMTPLHVAAMLGRDFEARWLLEHGAEADARDRFGDTPLHTAALFGVGQAMPALAAEQRLFGLRNHGGKTPFELALENGCQRTALLLRRLEREAESGRGGTRE